MTDPAALLLLLERLNDLVLTVDGDGSVQYAGAGAATLLGHAAPTLVRTDLASWMHPDDVDAWRLALEKVGLDADQRVELRLRAADGRWRTFDVTASNQLDDPALGAIVLAARAQADARDFGVDLHRNEQLMAALATNSTDVLMVIDGTATITWVSPSIEGAFGYPPAALIGTSGFDFVHADDVAEAAERLGWILEEPGRTQRTTWRAKHADGSWRAVEAVNVNLLDDPTVQGIVASFRDITDRRRIELALVESEQRFRAVVQNSRDVTGLLDLQGQVLWVSPNVLEMLGLEQESVTGQPGFDLVHPDDVRAALDRMSLVLTTDERVDPVALRLAHSQGFWIPVEIAGSRLRTDEGEVEGVIINIRDIAWRAEAERALTESEERFRALVQHSSDVVLIIDADGTMTYVSPAVERVFGRSAAALVGTTATPYIHSDDLASVADLVTNDVAEPGASATVAYRAADASGQWRPVEATVTNLLHEPAVGGMVWNIRDVGDRVAAEQALRDSEAMFRSVAESSPLGIYTVDSEGRCLYVNERWEQITGMPFAQAKGHGWANIVHPDDLEWLLADVGDSAFNEKFDLTYRIVRHDGEVRWLTVHTSVVEDPADDRLSSVGVIEDITDRIAAERDTQRLTDIFEATQDLIGIADAAGMLLYFNRAARRFFDLPLVGSVGHLNLTDVFAPWALDQVSLEIEPRLQREGIWSGELALAHPTGVEVPVLAQLLVHYDADGNLEFFSGVMRDISERKAFEHELAHQATHDPLTGLPNRVLLLDKLSTALDRARRHRTSVAVLFLDLDHFKVVNDSLGHGLGDRLLMAIADRLEVAVRPGDTIARFGGDEFVLLCENLDDPEAAITIARRVEHALAAPFVVDDAEIYVGVSIGIAHSDRDNDEAETLIRDADAAMYRAKEKGRARYEVFDAAMRDHAVDRLDIENALRRSLDGRQLRVHYQPIIDLTSGGIIGAEALLRWEHPDRGLLLPGEFIGIAEETGLIVSIGGWVLGQACRQLQRWAAEHPETADLIVTVNLSGRQLSHPRLVTEVKAVLSDTGIDPARLDLEITESVLMDDVDMSAATLGQLKDLGVRIVVDDFGTGYSSLSYLRQFPVDGMKVDRSFVDGLGTDAGDSAIVAAIVSLAHTLGLNAIAEGVETARHLRELRELGCDAAQGFFMARPLTPDAFLELVRTHPRF